MALIDDNAKIVMEKILGVKSGEKILILTNLEKDQQEIAVALARCAKEKGLVGLSLDGIVPPDMMLEDGFCVLQPTKTQTDFMEEYVRRAILLEPDICVAISNVKMGKDRVGLKKPYEWNGEKFLHAYHFMMYGKKCTRGFWNSGLSEDIFNRTIDIDYDGLKSLIKKINSVFERTRLIRVLTERGTDFVFSIEGRKAFLDDDGDFTKVGFGGNVPTGEIFISPKIDSGDGIIVFDGSINVGSTTLLLEEDPAILKLKAGHIVEYVGENGKLIEKQVLLAKEKAKEAFLGKEMEEYVHFADAIGEFGIGLNEKAQITGHPIEDEKAFRTCHFAVGANYDKDARALIHMDGIIRDPTVICILKDGSEEMIMKKGVFQIANP